MPDENLRLRISIARDSARDDLTIAELGALLTGISRSLNKIVAASPDARRLKLDDGYFPVSSEPVSVQFRISAIRRGSVEIQAAIDLLASVGLDAETAKALLLGILANALFDPGHTKALVYDFGRALRRIARGATGKTIELKVTLKGAAVQLTGKITNSGKVHVTIKHGVPDDTQ